jgi:endonuclease I
MNKRLLLQSLLALFFTCAWAQGPNDTGVYYSDADGKSGAALKTAMSTIINTGKNDITYDGLWQAYATTDKRADGFLRDWYSNTTKYVIGGDKQGKSYSKEGDSYNREHTVPQSWFSEQTPMKSDLVHVVPTDGYVNNRRSNYPFGEVLNVTYSSNNNYCKLGSSKTAGYSGTVFEPNDEIKGDIARIYFYMATCYEKKCSSWSGGVFSSENLGLKNWVVDMLMAWSKQDPVDDIERARNDAVQNTEVTLKGGKKKQNNRNPFVDYPGLEDYIWGDKQDVPFSYDNYNGGEQNYVARPTFSKDAGTYYNGIEVELNCATEGASIYYTLNGEDASEQSTLYEGPITLDEIGTYEIKAIAIKDGNRSSQATATYIIKEQPQPGDDIEIALNNAFFGTSYGGPMGSVADDLTGTQNGVTVVYALGSGSNRYCNNTQIRLYQNNTLTVSVAQGTLTSIDFVTTGGKTLNASVGNVNGYTWTGNAEQVAFSVNSGSGNLPISQLKIKVSGGSDPSGIDMVQTNTRLAGQRVIYDLSGRRVTNPTRGLYIVDGKKVFIR